MKRFASTIGACLALFASGCSLLTGPTLDPTTGPVARVTITEGGSSYFTLQGSGFTYWCPAHNDHRCSMVREGDKVEFYASDSGAVRSIIVRSNE